MLEASDREEIRFSLLDNMKNKEIPFNIYSSGWMGIKITENSYIM